MKRFISNPKLSDDKFNAGIISLKDGEFYFSFNIPQSDNFDLIFKFQENENTKSSPVGFSISNTNLNIYSNNNNITYLSEVEKNKDTTFFEDIIRISEPSTFSNFTGEFAYLKEGSPSLKNCTPADTIYLVENGVSVEYILPLENQRIYSIKKTASGKYNINRTMQNKTTMFKNISSGATKYYYNSNNIFDSAIPYEWKIIIAQGGKELSIFTKKANESSYTKKETILYNQNIENCFIMLEINDEMTLNNCSFRFFKADIS